MLLHFSSLSKLKIRDNHKVSDNTVITESVEPDPRKNVQMFKWCVATSAIFDSLWQSPSDKTNLNLGMAA